MRQSSFAVIFTVVLGLITTGFADDDKEKQDHSKAQSDDRNAAPGFEAEQRGQSTAAEATTPVDVKQDGGGPAAFLNDAENELAREKQSAAPQVGLAASVCLLTVFM